MNVLTILGTRPEIIRLSRIIATLDERCHHTVLFTGQNLAANLADVFFHELGVRPPDDTLAIGQYPFAEQVGVLFSGVARVMARVRPDRVVILGDTNSGLAALLAARMGVPVYHLEAGNRCGDPRSPEEVNRRVIDHCSSVLMPYTRHSRDRLLREGIPSDRVHVVGNPIFEVLQLFEPQIAASGMLAHLGLEAGGYFLMTAHRAETVDVPERLRTVLDTASAVAATYGLPVVFPVHPRTRDRMQAILGDVVPPGLRLVDALGFFDFVALERHARACLSDSGTVQEECAILGVPNVVIRDATERPETVETGASIVTGLAREPVLRALETLLARTATPAPPADYVLPDVADRVTRLVLAS